MEQNLFATILALGALSLFLLIMFFNTIIRQKYLNLWRKITVEYPKLEKKMLAFRPYQNPYGFMPILHSDYLLPIVKRFFSLESFSKTKTKDFYKKFYRYDLIDKINDKDLRKNMDFILKYAPIRDILVAIFFTFFIFSIIIGIIYSFRL